MPTIKRLISAIREGRVASGLRGRAARWSGPLRERIIEHSTARHAAIQIAGDVRAPFAGQIVAAVAAALTGEGKLPETVRSIKGMSGQRYRTFINELIGSLPNARYLEIGAWAGSTAASALYGNSNATAVVIDNWSLFGGPKEDFFRNMEPIVSASPSSFRFIEEDFRRIRFDELGPFNVYFFDGPHEERDQFDGVLLAQPALDKIHILIVDDWNFREVRLGTLRALRDLNAELLMSFVVRTSFDQKQPAIAGNKSDWHNGVFVGIVKKAS